MTAGILTGIRERDSGVDAHWKIRAPALPALFRRALLRHQVNPPSIVGCKPGDWHPSHILADTLKALICSGESTRTTGADSRRRLMPWDAVTPQSGASRARFPDEESADATALGCGMPPRPAAG